MNGGTLCFRVVRPSVRHTLGVPLCVQHPAKTMSFQQIIMHPLQYQHDVDVHLLFCFDLDLHITCSRGRVNFDFLRRFSLMGTIMRAAPSKSYAFSINYYVCIAIPSWHICAPPILFWPWPPLYITSPLRFSSSILTDGCHFACNDQPKLCLFNKLPYMQCNANIM